MLTNLDVWENKITDCAISAKLVVGVCACVL